MKNQDQLALTLDVVDFGPSWFVNCQHNTNMLVGSQITSCLWIDVGWTWVLERWVHELIVADNCFCTFDFRVAFLFCFATYIMGYEIPKGDYNWPAAGVMQTSPVIIPCTAPITDGLPKKATSKEVHVNKLVAAQTWVLRTATDEEMFAAYGAPPLNPDQPNQSSPAPVNISNMLLGENLSLSFFILGPTYVYIYASVSMY